LHLQPLLLRMCRCCCADDFFDNTHIYCHSNI
jgi:hypothetical protein